MRDFNKIIGEFYDSSNLDFDMASVQGRMTKLIINIDDYYFNIGFEFLDEGKGIWEKLKFNASKYPAGENQALDDWTNNGKKDDEFWELINDWETDWDMSKCLTTQEEVNNSTYLDKELNWLKGYLKKNPLEVWNKSDISKLMDALESSRPIVPVGVVNHMTIEMYEDEHGVSPWHNDWTGGECATYEIQQELVYSMIVDWIDNNSKLIPNNQDTQFTLMDRYVKSKTLDKNLSSEKQLNNIDEYYFSLRSLADNDNCTSDELHNLIGLNKSDYTPEIEDKNYADFRRINLLIDVASNYNLDEKALLELAHDNDENVRIAALKSRKLSPKSHNILLQADHDIKATAIMFNTSLSEEQLIKYASEDSVAIRISVIRNQNVTINILNRFINDPNEHASVHIESASSSKFKPNILKKMFFNNDLSSLVHTGIASNKSLSSSVLKEFYDYCDNEWIQREIVSNEKMTSHLLEDIVEHGAHEIILEGIIKNKNTPQYVLRRIYDMDVFIGQNEWKYNVNTPLDILENISDPKNENTPLQVLKKLSHSDLYFKCEEAKESLYLKTQNKARQQKNSLICYQYRDRHRNPWVYK